MFDQNSILNIFNLKDKIAVVTGALGNLGPVWIKALLEAGALVAAIDLPDITAPGVFQDLLLKYKSRLLLFESDITNKETLGMTHKKINREFGNIRIIVNNAGIDAPPRLNYDKTDYKISENMWKVNVQGAVNCIEEFFEDMKKIKSGSIVNIASLYATVSPYEGLYSHLNFDKPWAYGSTKAAVLQLTRHFATRMAKWNIRVNALSPGGVIGSQDKNFIKKFSERVPLRRMADKEKDLGPSLIYLASDASRYVTGINLDISGGYNSW